MFALDRPTNRWWIGDVGQARQEGVAAVAGTARWANLGWSCREGLLIYNASRCAAGAVYTNPVIAYARTVGTTVTGGVVYGGRAYASLLAGTYIFSDFGAGRVMLYRGVLAIGPRHIAGVTAINADDAGEVWAVTIGGVLATMRASLK